MDQRLLLMHQAMLSDRRRIDAYDRALERTVRPGDVVADVGAGMLVLSMLALRHGAKHVFAIEADPATAAVASAIAERNDLKGRLTLIQGAAHKVRLPVQADVVVAEMMGNLGPEEQMMTVLGTFARRNLRPGGHVIPRTLVTRLTAIEFDDEGWGIWDEDYHGYQLDVVQEHVQPRAQLHFFQRPPMLLTKPTAVTEGKSRTLTVTRPGRLHAIAGYFESTLAPGVSLSNFPSYPGCNWAVWIWPLRHTDVAVGDALRVKIRPSENERLVTDWTLECGLRRKAAA
ncbi:MAG: 50S ribosomal protein L11 methyltransferase [Streptosporangiaceae bacterium]|nr:50S ribosomal protein L11 methyltransferase [Streptosporangiaceae bacterium]